jgi:hypothetical protein
MSASPLLITGAYYVLCDAGWQKEKGDPVVMVALRVLRKHELSKSGRRQRETHPRLDPAASEDT